MPRAITIINKPSMGKACMSVVNAIDRQCFITTEVNGGTLTNYRTGIIVATLVRQESTSITAVVVCVV